MCHVDDPHQAEGDREPDRYDKKDRPGGKTAEQRACGVDAGNVRLDAAYCEEGCFLHLLVTRFLGLEGDGLEKIEGWQRPAIP